MKINNKSVCYLVLEGANPCYPKYKTIFHLKEMEMGSQQIDAVYLGRGRLKDLKRKPKISGTFTVDRIEVKTKEWWQFWRIL